MLSKIITTIFGSSNDRALKALNKRVEKINQLEADFEKLSDQELREKTKEFKERLANGEKVNDILHEAFATVREASKRVNGMRHFDVQLVGGMVLVDRNISEMRTGEGKTLTATLPSYLHSLSGKGVHIVTVNDYLASRDANTNRKLFEFLGLTVGVNIPGLTSEQKREAYQCDILYSTNSELGFDYLRDNLAHRLEDKVQRDLHYALVDEVDSILIDEARTPLIISGPAEHSEELYKAVDKIIPALIYQEKEDTEEEIGDGDFTLDLKNKQAHLTDRGQEKAEKMLCELGLIPEGESIYSPEYSILLHHTYAALRAHKLFHRNVDYMVKNGEVLIIDEHTGRTMEGRRWSEGLHQAIEAKEGVHIQGENQTVASITYQNYFRLYDTLAGMTGTADTEAFEFQQIYGLNTVVIPTNKPMIRDDKTDLMYKCEEDKFKAVIEDIKDCQERGQPVLVGTISVEKSELLSRELDKAKIEHKVLNAKFHQQESEIIANAGDIGAVTIATNMAGRGTDIVLGGNYKTEINALENPTDEQIKAIEDAWIERHNRVKEAGGLHIIGTERHESRRIDNQLRGRSGRQGDPGSSRFYLSLDDDLLRKFLPENRLSFMRKAFGDSTEALESKMFTKVIAGTQAKMEAHNFDARKYILQFDDIANDQRKIIYEQRNELLAKADLSETIANIRTDVLENLMGQYIPAGSFEEMWDLEGLQTRLKDDFDLELPIVQWVEEDNHLDDQALFDRVLEKLNQEMTEKEALAGSEVMRQVEQSVMLQYLDELWREHLAQMDYLRKSINLRGYAQKDPKQEFKRESFALFTHMLETLKYQTISTLARAKLKSQEEIEQERRMQEELMQHMKKQANNSPAQPNNDGEYANLNISRNSPCPCGSNKKYKHCHGNLSRYKA